MSTFAVLNGVIILAVFVVTAACLDDQKPIREGGKALSGEAAKHLCRIKQISELLGSRAEFELIRDGSKFTSERQVLRNVQDKITEGVKGINELFGRHCRRVSLGIEGGGSDMLSNPNCEDSDKKEGTGEATDQGSGTLSEEGIIQCEHDNFLRDFLIRGALEAYRSQMEQWEKKKPTEGNKTSTEGKGDESSKKHEDQCQQMGYSVHGACTVSEQKWRQHLEEAVKLMESIIVVKKEDVCGVSKEGETQK
ncbi:T. brucei spp.-specific protein [Trypanosoma brucei gambiense DAL972]|uniref:T. brucei spp.-specific protein n=1 Tax=Trypanosoma brucei gambiense (strain MHOM/CI/86/DAL972) TaxID=679716 RepID=D0A468_TRYB9|nr:T. brucei spp.-specific protein [Trypanosoma brucei gambiense DAL972]CBH16062.1 T. brucei spp.-specific protein [Trypanosoma brucei gambiense DAL972]|eukprot:XP_011778326.1 T. brucei spp.-specific protein [Trypanosoma brucei gambiense DAL972]